MSKENALFHQVKDHIAFDTLWAQVMDTVTTLSGKRWTDMGDHDPGITLLQALTWNSADLSYRTSLSLNDLLTAAGQDTLFPPEFGPHNILTCSTVTAEDYRRALRDLHSSDTTLKTKNADFLINDAYLVREPEANRFHWWYNAEKREYSFAEPGEVEGDDKHKLNLRGNYWLYILPTRFTEALSTADKAVVDAYLDTFLNSHRNLGEAVARIIWLQPTWFRPVLTVELSADVADVNQVAAQIYQTIEALLLPAATHQTTAQRQAAGDSDEAIFEGPFLQHGWQRASASRITEQGITINLSPLFNQLLAIPGVASISRFSLVGENNIHAIPGESWSWQVDEGYYPQLWATDPLKILTNPAWFKLIAKGGISAVVNKDKVAAYLTVDPLIQMAPVVLPAGDVRNLAHYTPAGHRLPGGYRLQEPDDVIDDAVRELHQFLLPVDQLLADGGAALAALPQQLAFTGREAANVIRGTRWPYDAASVNQQVHRDYADQLQRFQQQDAEIVYEQDDGVPHPNFNRELDFINYLLGYFGSNRAARPLTLDARDFLATQRAYLAQQPSLGYDRINIRVDQVSALQKRIAARIGLNSECFATSPDLGKLPFYLIEHRQLMPRMPDDAFNSQQKPTGFSVDGAVVTVTQKGGAGKLFRGQLIELIATEADSELHVGPLLISKVQGDSFTLSTDDSQQLARDLARLQTAWAAKKLVWRNSDVWLQDMDYRLNYADDQPTNDNQRRLASSDQSFYPAMMAVGDKIIIRPASLGAKVANRSASVKAGEWLIEATIKECDVVTGTILIEKTAKSEKFPSADQAWQYQWHFTKADYATTDRFSFSVSIVNNRALIDNTQIDSYSLIDWLLETIMPEFPAHVSLITHWLSDSAFKNFAATYKRWQNNGNPLGDDAFSIMKMLTLGQLPQTPLGIGLMRIATEEQQTAVMGEDGSEWHTDIILSEELLHVPQDVSSV